MNAAVTVGDITIGDVGIIADDAVGASGSINRIQNADLTSSLLALDPRMKFNVNELKTLAYGNNAGSDVAISVDGTGKLNVNIASAGTVTVTSNDALFSGGPTATTDILSDILLMDVRHFLNKTAVVKNTGANAAGITITASVDGGVTHAIPLASNLEVPAGTTYVYTHNSAITNLKIQMKSYVAGNHTTVGVTAYAMGA